MKENTLKITIDRPVSEVFAFSINPKNTPLWFTNILEEIATEYPPKIGTIYKSRRVSSPDVWGDVVVTGIKQNEYFQLKGKTFNVRYTFDSTPPNATELTYTEWADNGDLGGLTPYENLEKLKAAIMAAGKV
jgi:hypothetical protein